MKYQYAIHVLEEGIRERKETLLDLEDEQKELIFGKEQIESVRERIRQQIKELEKAIDILEESDS